MTGTLPPIFENFIELSQFQISDNNFSGKIPESLWNLTSLDSLNLQNNHLSGTVPGDICNDRSVLVDNSNWFVNKPKVECECCGISPSCYLWDMKEATISGIKPPLCPRNNIFHIDFSGMYVLTEKLKDVSISERKPPGEFETDFCLSPTGCYNVLYRIGNFFNRGIESFNFSYSASEMSLTQRDECDAVDICGTSISSSDPKRIKLNHITQLGTPDLAALNNSFTPAYQALCWIMTEDPLLDDYDVCDGTLLQRFVLALFYNSLGMSDEFEKIASQHTCAWPGITCDFENKYVEHINISQRSLQGTLITEIGLLARLQTIDLSENQLQGRISDEIFLNLPNLQVFNVGYNNFGGRLPKDLYQISQLKTLNVTNNAFVGTLLDDITYSNNLGK